MLSRNYYVALVMILMMIGKVEAKAALFTQ